MRDKTELRARLEFRKEALAQAWKAYIALLDGGVKSYTLRNRLLTNLDLPDLFKEIQEMEKKVDELETLLEGGSARRAVGVVPMDW